MIERRRLVDLADQSRLGGVAPLVVVPLDDAGGSVDRRRALARRLASLPGLVVGLAERLSPDVAEVARACTLTLVASGTEQTTVTVDDVGQALALLEQRTAACPNAAVILGQVLRAAHGLSIQEALWVESLAYSSLLGGGEFRRWRASMPVGDRTSSLGAVRTERSGEVLRVILDRPERRNALDASARRDLSEALDVALADTTLQVELRGKGPVFCSGGDLHEFGTATDLALAHRLRMEVGPASLLAEVADRTTAFVHGGCVGAGVELPAFASRVVAAPGTTFRLPEVSMGLIPGAGGTVSISRRIGRWRTAWLCLTGQELDLDTALAWGLVDDVA